jgi:hypothetical protein
MFSKKRAIFSSSLAGFAYILVILIVPHLAESKLTRMLTAPIALLQPFLKYINPEDLGIGGLLLFSILGLLVIGLSFGALCYLLLFLFSKLRVRTKDR